jgi:hypothetical protein
MIPASQPACVLVSDHAVMNCDSKAGTIEYPAKLRISAAHIAVTIAGEGAPGAEQAELTLDGGFQKLVTRIGVSPAIGARGGRTKATSFLHRSGQAFAKIRPGG